MEQGLEPAAKATSECLELHLLTEETPRRKTCGKVAVKACPFVEMNHMTVKSSLRKVPRDGSRPKFRQHIGERAKGFLSDTLGIGPSDSTTADKGKMTGE